ncbi:MAG: hypothetical protein ABJF11_10740, partial [Reichenbachiella sp.]|uniref:hypothetical protein n=1 Tax=Reichenbachiella sp. TaxID=2184521 RepID=UPI00326400F2
HVTTSRQWNSMFFHLRNAISNIGFIVEIIVVEVYQYLTQSTRNRKIPFGPCIITDVTLKILTS